MPHCSLPPVPMCWWQAMPYSNRTIHKKPFTRCAPPNNLTFLKRSHCDEHTSTPPIDTCSRQRQGADASPPLDICGCNTKKNRQPAGRRHCRRVCRRWHMARYGLLSRRLHYGEGAFVRHPGCGPRPTPRFLAQLAPSSCQLSQKARIFHLSQHPSAESTCLRGNNQCVSHSEWRRRFLARTDSRLLQWRGGATSPLRFYAPTIPLDSHAAHRIVGFL